VAEVAGEAIPAEVFRTRYIDYLLQTGLADTSHRRAAFLKRLIRVKLIVQEAKAGGNTEAAPYPFEKEGIYRKLLPTWASTRSISTRFSTPARSTNTMAPASTTSIPTSAPTPTATSR